MDHTYIDENGLVELYHQGTLAPEEETRFEVHFVDCPRCIEALEAARGFRAGIRVMAAEDAARIGILAAVTRLLQQPRAAMLLGGGLGAMMLAAVWLGGEIRRPPSMGEQPLANTPIFILSVVRGSDDPAAVIDLGQVGEWLSLAVDVDIDPDIVSYRVEVSGGSNDDVWRRDDLQPNAFETLMITFPASYFSASEYQLEVEGLLATGEAVEVESFDFRVTDSR